MKMDTCQFGLVNLPRHLSGGCACSFRLNDTSPCSLTHLRAIRHQLNSFTCCDFMMGLFCDCFRRRPLVDAYSKPGYARMVEAKEPPSYSTLPIDVATVSSRRRCSWETIGADEDARLLSPALALIDEKEPLEPPVESSASSQRSSIISIPSTRVTARTITTLNTGASLASRRSHESGATIGAPPSYSSRRSASRQRSNRSSWDQRHPVLAEDWFDQFRES